MTRIRTGFADRRTMEKGSRERAVSPARRSPQGINARGWRTRKIPVSSTRTERIFARGSRV